MTFSGIELLLPKWVQYWPPGCRRSGVRHHCASAWLGMTRLSHYSYPFNPLGILGMAGLGHGWDKFNYMHSSKLVNMWVKKIRCFCITYPCIMSPFIVPDKRKLENCRNTVSEHLWIIPFLQKVSGMSGSSFSNGMWASWWASRDGT